MHKSNHDKGIIAGEEEDIDDRSNYVVPRNAHHNRVMDRQHATGIGRLEAITSKYEERGDDGDYDDVLDDEDEYEGEEDNAILQQGLLPSVRDPKLWMMTCKVGKEREIALTIMQKFIDKENATDRLLVKSVVCPEHLKGHMYLYI